MSNTGNNGGATSNPWSSSGMVLSYSSEWLNAAAPNVPAPPFAGADDHVVVVVVPMSSLATLTDADVLGLIERDIALRADEILIHQDEGRYRIIKSRTDPEDVGSEVLSEAEQVELLRRIYKRLSDEG